MRLIPKAVTRTDLIRGQFCEIEAKTVNHQPNSRHTTQSDFLMKLMQKKKSKTSRPNNSLERCLCDQTGRDNIEI